MLKKCKSTFIHLFYYSIFLKKWQEVMKKTKTNLVFFNLEKFYKKRENFTK